METLIIERAPALDQLKPFIGNWKLEGHNGTGSPIAAGAAVTGKESYAWLPGEHFLTVEWEMKGADFVNQGLSVIGFCTEMGSLALRMFDSAGFYRKYRATAENNTLTLTGDTERATMRIAEDGTTMHTKWEIKTEDGGWQPLCDLTETKSRT